MSLIVIGSMAAGVAMLANSNEDSPVLWGTLTFMAGIVGSSVFGFVGATIGCFVAAGLYATKITKFG